MNIQVSVSCNAGKKIFNAWLTAERRELDAQEAEEKDDIFSDLN